MIRGILKIGLLLVVGIIGYNYFFGTVEEKQTSKAIVNEVKDLGKSMFNLLKSEKDKLEEGKYDGALSKIGDLFDKMKVKANEQGGKLKGRIEELEDKKGDLEKRIKEAENDPEADASNLKKELEDLFRETEQVVKELEE